MQHRRWSDSDRHFGPFTYACGREYRPLAVILDSGDGDEYPGCYLQISALGHTLLIALPAIIRPWREWVDTSQYSQNPGFWRTGSRRYGVSVHDGYVSVPLGRVTDDSSTEQHWGYFLPWSQWRQVRHQYFGADGITVVGNPAPVLFNVIDYDGERIEASTYVEEREWRRGDGWWSWIGFVAPVKRRRSVDITFAKEVGRDKGSWKGGVTRTGIEMLAGETHEQAFERFCEQDHPAKNGRYRLACAGKHERDKEEK